MPTMREAVAQVFEPAKPVVQSRLLVGYYQMKTDGVAGDARRCSAAAAAAAASTKSSHLMSFTHDQNLAEL